MYVAKESCSEAAEMERPVTLENIEKFKKKCCKFVCKNAIPGSKNCILSVFIINYIKLYRSAIFFCNYEINLNDVSYI